MGLISPGEENLLDFLELQQVLSTYDEDLNLIWSARVVACNNRGETIFLVLMPS